jgi:hypothetical protein
METHKNMTLLKTRHMALLLAGVLASAGVARAQSATDDLLLKLLVKRGIISQQDVADIKQELAAAQAAAPQAAPAPASAAPSGAAGTSSAAVAMKDNGASPLFFKIGVANFTPYGFLDFTAVYRNEATGSAIGTSFNSIPYSNGSTGQLSETKFSAQNSRVGLRIDADAADTKVLALIETDFLGNAPTNLGVSSNGATLRMRNYFADVRKGDLEFLAGQEWSMLTPNRRGISPVPSDIFYTNDVDTNYQVGLTWARQPQIRLVYHATDSLTAGISLENPDQYVGGTVVLPSAFTASEVDQGTATSQPNIFPDVIAKVAYDTKIADGLPFHAEVAGLFRQFKINTYSSTINTDDTARGGGLSGAFNLAVTKQLTLLATGFYSYGGGRYINGQGPDFTVSPADSTGAYHIGLVKASSYVVGAEWAVAPVDTVSAYWSVANFGQRYEQNPNGTYVGYGYPGSSNSHNKDISEWTVTNSYTFWKNPTYGALQFLAQASHVQREPWYVAAGALSKADANMLFLDLRYVLP